MDIGEANIVLDQHLRELRAHSYSELKRLVERRIIQAPEIRGSSGTTYYLEVQAFWDDRPQGNVRIVVSIDDGRRSALRPLTRGFIKAPDESFIGE